jgi:hypothetical protein
LDEVIYNLPIKKYNGIARFGNDLDKPHQVLTKKVNKCMTTIVGTRCSLLKQIKLPKGRVSLEEEWGKVLNKTDNVKLLTRLGITARIAGFNYMKVDL